MEYLTSRPGSAGHTVFVSLVSSPMESPIFFTVFFSTIILACVSDAVKRKKYISVNIDIKYFHISDFYCKFRLQFSNVESFYFIYDQPHQHFRSSIFDGHNSRRCFFLVTLSIAFTTSLMHVGMPQGSRY